MNENVKALFADNILGTLATVHQDGSPWATPLHVVSDGEALYWFSKESTLHSQNIARDARVSVALFSPDESSGPKGVYVNGKAEKLSGEQAARAREVFTARVGVLPPVFEAASSYRVPLGTLDTKKSTSNCWYFYS